MSVVGRFENHGNRREFAKLGRRLRLCPDILVSMTKLVLTRHVMARRGKRLEYFTVAWNCLEGIVAVAAGVIAGSISLVGFGVDSFIEVTSGAALLWRMSVDAEESQASGSSG